jgi:hypothetical protein
MTNIAPFVMTLGCVTVAVLLATVFLSRVVWSAITPHLTVLHFGLMMVLASMITLTLGTTIHSRYKSGQPHISSAVIDDCSAIGRGSHKKGKGQRGNKKKGKGTAVEERKKTIR